MTITKEEAIEIMRKKFPDKETTDIVATDKGDHWQIGVMIYNGEHTLLNLYTGVPRYLMNKETGEIMTIPTSEL